jgi:hypothetical protein
MAETSLEKVFGLATSYWASRTLHASAEIGVADALGDDPRTAEQLASDVKADAGALFRALRLLASVGVFEQRGNQWAHTDQSRLLRSDNPQSLRAFVRMIGGSTAWQGWAELEHSIRTGDTGVSKLDTGGIFAYLAKHPEESRLFNEAMSAKAKRDIPPIVEAYDFSRFKRIADIGGGRGHLLSSILGKTASANGILFDQEHVVAQAPKSDPRIEVRAGDFFREVPAADAYVMMDILHDWNDADASRILNTIRKAAPKGAIVLTAETVVPENPEPHLAKALDINMLVLTGGRERTASEHEALLRKAGFRMTRVVPTASPYSLVEAVTAD